MMTFSLRPKQRIVLALDRRVGENARRLLEARRREERLRRERRLRDAEQHRICRCRLRFSALVRSLASWNVRRFDDLARQHQRVAAFDDLHLAHHRANDDFDVLVVDVDALRAIDLLHFLNQVVLQRGLALDAQDVVRIERAFVELIARSRRLTVLHRQMRALRNIVLVLFARRVGDEDDALVACRRRT